MSGQSNAYQSNTFYWSHWHIRLRQILVDYFDESELETLCFDLRVDYESLGGKGKAKNAIALIELLVRLGRIVELIDYCSQLRPNIPWSDLREAAIGNPLIVANAPDRGLSEGMPDHQQTKRASSSRSHATPYVIGIGTAVVGLVVTVVLFVVRSPQNPEMLPSPTPMATNTPALANTAPRTLTSVPIIQRQAQFRVEFTGPLKSYDFDGGQTFDDYQNPVVDFFFKPDNAANPKSLIGVSPAHGAKLGGGFPDVLPWEVPKDQFMTSSYSVPQNREIPCVTSQGVYCSFMLIMADNGLTINYHVYNR